MCGIAGILSKNPSLVSTQKLKRMTDAIEHRGPDGEGQWIGQKGNVGLGHRRLSIIDLSTAAAQPMHYLGRYSITFNGEIYNYLEIKETLFKQGYSFSSASDTEVILAAFDYWKTDCLQQFDGMFAFAIWDEETQQLFCARDRFGEKPFYFFQDENQFLFASEMKALWAVGIEKKIKNTQLLNYLTNGLLQNVARPDVTFFEEIYTLPPSNYLIIQLPELEIKVTRYWDIDKETTDFKITEKEATEKFLELLKNSVSKRLRSDVAVGTSLSGGLDSSTIVSLLSKLKAESSKLITFSAVFPGFEKDESKYINEIVQQFGVDNLTVTPTAASFESSLRQMMYHQEEPLQSASAFAQWEVYKLAKEHGVTVILDGQGADETLAGYHKYYHWYWQELLANGQWAMVKKEIKAARKLDIKEPWNFKNKLAAFLPERAAIALQKKALNQQAKHPFINKEFLMDAQTKFSLGKPIVRKLNDILYFDTAQLGLQDLLRYADRNSMARGREVRLPFLNHELVQFVFSLPTSMKIKEGWTKWILRNAMSATLPANIVWRRDKIGYEPPQQQWLQQPAIIEQIMESRKQLVNEKILQPKVLNTPIMASHAHDADNFDWRCLCAANM